MGAGSENLQSSTIHQPGKFRKRFRTNLLKTYKIHNFIRKTILSNFVSVELEQGERLGVNPSRANVKQDEPARKMNSIARSLHCER